MLSPFEGRPSVNAPHYKSCNPASIAQAANSLLHQQHGHQRPSSTHYVGDSRPPALSCSCMGAAMCIPRFAEQRVTWKTMRLTFSWRASPQKQEGRHPHHRSITWTNTHPPLPSQSQPIRQRDVHGDRAVEGGPQRCTSLRTLHLTLYPGDMSRSYNKLPQVEGS